MFGDRFYPLLAHLSPWKQSLFALALAQRQLANFCLWSSLAKQDQGSTHFANCLKQLWYYHQDKFNHIDLSKALAQFDPFVPDLEQEADPEDPSTGALLATDAAICLTVAYDAILMHEGNEAEIASRASLSAAILVARQRAEDFLDDEALRDTAEVDNEVNFQVSLLELLIKAQRDPSLVHLILKSSTKDGCSNIGLTLTEDLPYLHADFYALEVQKLKAAAAQGKAATAHKAKVSSPYGKVPRGGRKHGAPGHKLKGRDN
ncbi:MAG: YjaG family protein [Candidatus Anaerobiospirillum merdipullorum]|uniref:YjaG family protein n=1 Tax=Candidatus Anaerobiospirillum merdipullorum TaxID=2838450 RepID=A0A9E2NUD9_9GAMM|nr:YjaG family protein [Candidatus Anaerobiospirillum merdipullorum]